VKEALGGTTLDQDSLKTVWEGVIRQPMTSPRSSGGGLSGLKSAFGSAATSLKNLKNKVLSPTHRFFYKFSSVCLAGHLVQFNQSLITVK
jgi:hypothetical protein